MKIVPTETIGKINELVVGSPCGEERAERAGACLCGVAYYDDPRERIAGVVLSLLKGHFFVDGNKRTAFIVYVVLCQLNDLPPLEGVARQVEAFVALAAGRETVSQCAKILFPGIGSEKAE